jgi:hypothetical protein
MEESKLILEFYLDDGEVGAGDLTTMAKIVEDFTWAVAVHESNELLHDLDYPQANRFEALHNFKNLGVTPAKIEKLKHDSIFISVIISSPIVLWGLRKFVAKPLEDAWETSKLRGKVVDFVRNKMFMGAQSVIEEKAADKAQYRHLKISEVKIDESINRGGKRIRINVKRAEIDLLEATDTEAIDGLIKKMGGF